MNQAAFTRGQLERQLSQKIQALYREHLGHKPSKVICQLADSKLTVIIEDSITQAEKLLAEEGCSKLAEEVRTTLSDAVLQPIQSEMEAILGVSVLDMMVDSTLETGRTGIIAILSDTPQTRSPKSAKSE